MNTSKQVSEIKSGGLLAEKNNPVPSTSRYVKKIYTSSTGGLPHPPG